jgi:hypothetical protein
LMIAALVALFATAMLLMERGSGIRD